MSVGCSNGPKLMIYFCFRFPKVLLHVNFLKSDTKEVIKGYVEDLKEEIISSQREDINKIIDT